MMVGEVMPIAAPVLFGGPALLDVCYSLAIVMLNRGFDQKALFNEPAERND